MPFPVPFPVPFSIPFPCSHARFIFYPVVFPRIISSGTETERWAVCVPRRRYSLNPRSLCRKLNHRPSRLVHGLRISRGSLAQCKLPAFGFSGTMMLLEQDQWRSPPVLTSLYVEGGAIPCRLLDASHTFRFWHPVVLSFTPRQGPFSNCSTNQGRFNAFIFGIEKP